MVVDSNENITALSVDRSNAYFDKEIKFSSEETMIDIEKIFGILMENRLGELRSVIREMVKEENSRGKDVHHTKKKSRAQRELDKLAFSVNYGQPMGNKGTCMQLLGLKFISWNFLGMNLSSRRVVMKGVFQSFKRELLFI